MTSPNKQQQQLIDNTEGIYIVDAGAGTGKTFSITKRYLNILEKTGPENIFLATFTRNAADEMAERIIQGTDYPASKIFEAPISTFHSHCQKIIERHGFNAPELLGIEDSLTENIRVLESAVRERQEFDEFYRQFRQNNEQHNDYYRIVRDSSDLLNLLKSLASKGIFPTQEGWFRNSEENLDGDFKEFSKLFNEANKPEKTANGSRQSELRNRIYSYKWKTFKDDAPELDEIRGDRGTKQVRRDFCRKAFQEDREDLKQFVHDLYFEYIKHCLSRNYLNFSFLIMFAFLILHEKPAVRERESFEYMMIDEFQDTNPLQFKLALLLADKPNICVVGDWKQSIYSFQYASVENIQKFQKRIKKYRDELNRDSERVSFEVDDVEQIKLKKNYRSTQEILDFAEKSFELPGYDRETLKPEDITSLESQTATQKSTVEVCSCEDEAENLLAMIQEIVDNEIFTYGEDGRTLDYGDMAVLTRTRSFGLDLQEKAREYGIPVAYEGGVELFKTNPAIILLAWLRVMNGDARRGWAVILEESGYTLDESKHILKEKEFPDSMVEFRDELRSEDSIGAVARKVFRKYGFNDAFADKIVEVLKDTFDTTYMTKSEIINFMEQNIEEGEIYQVDNSMDENTVKIQTLHSAKGLEYPAVFISDVNQGMFPSRHGFRSSITYQDPIGLRQTKIYYEDEYAYTYDNWQTEILFKTLSGDYDEERRLMYVGMTRAEQHLFITAEQGRESTFFTELDVEPREVSKEPEEISISTRNDRDVLHVE